MFASVLYRMEQSPVVTSIAPFTDVTSGSWFYNGVVWAYREGIVSGTSATTFSPNDNITREQMVAMLYRFKTMQSGASNADLSAISGFADQAAIAPWATTAFCWAVDSGIINGSDNLLMPQGNADRAQIAAILMRYLQA